MIDLNSHLDYAPDSPPDYSDADSPLLSPGVVEVAEKRRGRPPKAKKSVNLAAWNMTAEDVIACSVEAQQQVRAVLSPHAVYLVYTALWRVLSAKGILHSDLEAGKQAAQAFYDAYIAKSLPGQSS